MYKTERAENILYGENYSRKVDNWKATNPKAYNDFKDNLVLNGKQYSPKDLLETYFEAVAIAGITNEEQTPKGQLEYNDSLKEINVIEDNEAIHVIESIHGGTIKQTPTTKERRYNLKNNGIKIKRNESLFYNEDKDNEAYIYNQINKEVRVIAITDILISEYDNETWGESAVGLGFTSGPLLLQGLAVVDPEVEALFKQL